MGRITSESDFNPSPPPSIPSCSSRSSYSAAWADTNDEHHTEDTPGREGDAALDLTTTPALDLVLYSASGPPPSRSCSPCSSRSSFSAGWSPAGSEYNVTIPRVILGAFAINIIQRSSKRALVVGINYTSPGHDPSRRLRYAVNDARCVASSLRACGFPDEAVIVLTDQADQEESKRATHGSLISWIDWLVKDAKAGDLLVFFFSGHSCPEDSSLMMEDGERLGRDLLHDRLILPIPMKGNLYIMLDCSSASSLIQLQHCVGRMGPRLSIQPLSTRELALGQAPAIPGLSPGHGGAIGPSQGRSAGIVLDITKTFARGIPRIFSRVYRILTNRARAPPHASTVRDKSRGRHAPTQSGHSKDYFLERSGRFVKPAGRVMLWASTGAYQSTFEAYNGRGVRNGAKIRNSIVPHAICTTLDACAGSGLLVRDLWHRIVRQVEQENDWRRARDAAKPWLSRPNPFFREQCAELWVSQPEPLSTAGAVLDRPVFSA